MSKEKKSEMRRTFDGAVVLGMDDMAYNEKSLILLNTQTINQ